MLFEKKELPDLLNQNVNLWDALPVSLICIDSMNRTIVSVNQRFLDLFGDSKKIVGKSFDDHFILQIPFGSPSHDEYTYRFQPTNKRSYIVTTQHQLLPTDRHHLELITVLPTPYHSFDKKKFSNNKPALKYPPKSGVIWLNDQFEIVNASLHAYQIWGFEVNDELLQLSFEDLFIDKDTFQNTIQNLMKKGSWKETLMSVHATNEPFPLQFDVERAITNEQHQKWMVTCVNLSTQNKLDKLLERERSRLNKITTSAPNSIIISDDQGKIVFCNKRTEQIFGFTNHEMIGQNVEMLMPENFRKKHFKYKKEYMENPVMRPMRSQINLFGQHKNGTIFPVDISLGPYMENDQNFIILIIHDISDHKEIENKLKSEKKYIRLLHELSIIDSQSNSIPELLTSSIATCSRYMNWPVGHAYLPANDGSEEFIPSGDWYLADSKQYRAFKAITMQTRFRKGHGLIGKVMQTGEPQWIKNCQEDPDYHRRFDNLELGVSSAFAIPVIIKNRLACILEFYSDKTQISDENLIEKLVTIGNQIGLVMERIQSKSELIESETKLKTIFHSSRDAILLTDGTYLLDFNQKATQMLGLQPSKHDKIKVSSIFLHQQEEIKKLAGQLNHTLKKAQSKEILNRNWTIFPYHKKKIDVEVDFIPYTHDEQHHILIYIKDITVRLKTEKLIRKNVKLFRQLFNNSPVGIVMMDNQSRIMNTNESFTKIFGYTLKELKGKYLDEFIIPKDQRKKAHVYNERARKGTPFHVEADRMHKDGTIRSVVVGGSSVVIEGKLEAIFGVYVDISDRIWAENEIKKLNKELEDKVHKRTRELTLINDELQAFSYSVSHDLRAPLRGIDGFSHALLENYGDILNDRGHEYLGRIRQSAQKMGNLIDRVISLARVSRSEMNLMDVNLTVLAKSIVKQLQSMNPERVVDIKIQPDMVAVADPTLIEMVLQNLLGNAWKYTGKKEEARIEFGIVNDDTIHSYYIRDNGIGFDQKYAEDIFTPFKRLHVDSEFEGTGIGLSTVKRIIHRHHGHIYAKGNVNQGATFYFSLNTESNSNKKELIKN